MKKSPSSNSSSNLIARGLAAAMAFSMVACSQGKITAKYAVAGKASVDSFAKTQKMETAAANLKLTEQKIFPMAEANYDIKSNGWRYRGTRLTVKQADNAKEISTVVGEINLSAADSEKMYNELMADPETMKDSEGKEIPNQTVKSGKHSVCSHSLIADLENPTNSQIKYTCKITIEPKILTAMDVTTSNKNLAQQVKENAAKIAKEPIQSKDYTGDNFQFLRSPKGNTGILILAGEDARALYSIMQQGTLKAVKSKSSKVDEDTIKTYYGSNGRCSVTYDDTLTQAKFLCSISLDPASGTLDPDSVPIEKPRSQTAKVVDGDLPPPTEL